VSVGTQKKPIVANARRAPGSVLVRHAEDRLAKFFAHASPSAMSPMPGEPIPVKLEANSLPTNDGLGVNEVQGFLPSWPEAPLHNPKESFSMRKLTPRAILCEN
jgi:hypothetical protein